MGRFFVPEVTGSGQLGVDVGVRLSAFAKLQTKTAFGDPGFSYNGDWEYRFIDYNLSRMKIKGTVKETDGDRDLDNNPVLPGVEVKAQKLFFGIPDAFTPRLKLPRMKAEI